MPSQKILQEKEQIVDALAQRLKGAVAGVVVSYKGITVADDTALRCKLREAGVQYTVVKNTLLSRATAKADLAALEDVLTGTTALATCENDHIAAAKVLCEYAEKNTKFEVKSGFVEGRVVSANEVKELAKMPPKEVLVAMVLGGLNAPISGFVGVLSATMRGLVVALNAIAEKQSA